MDVGSELDQVKNELKAYKDYLEGLNAEKIAIDQLLVETLKSALDAKKKVILYETKNQKAEAENVRLQAENARLTDEIKKQKEEIKLLSAEDEPHFVSGIQLCVDEVINDVAV